MSKKILITAGPTREPIDPVRYISNYSTGTFGYHIAEAFRDKGYDVCLISGPVGLQTPLGVEVIKVETTAEMKKAVLSKAGSCDCLIMAAAVSDFKPRRKSDHKIKKEVDLTIELEKNPDILAEVSRRDGLIKVGFALETRNSIENSENKLKAKDLDMIIINTKESYNDPFGPGKKKYIVMTREGIVETHENIEKKEMAGKIAEKIGEMMA